MRVDRDIIVENVLQGGQLPAYTFTHAATAGFTSRRSTTAPGPRTSATPRRIELLAEAGYGPDNPLKFTYLQHVGGAQEDRHRGQPDVEAELGVDVTLENQEWKTFLTRRGNHDFEMARGAWCGDYNEASTFLDLCTTQSGYNDGKYSTTPESTSCWPRPRRRTTRSRTTPASRKSSPTRCR